MRLERQFRVVKPREKVIAVIEQDDTLTGLFPDTDTRVVERKGDSKTTVSRYRALGREGEATFHFTFLVDGNVRFEKVCDGKVWRSLRGTLTFEERGKGTRVCVELEGKTKTLVPEFTIKGPMEEQIDQMVAALKQRIKAGKQASPDRQARRARGEPGAQ
jgi:carbon monoxide dehydrogenase subunit G